MTRVDYCVPTMERPQVLERLLFSIATHRPRASIHVADQSESFDLSIHESLGERLVEAGLPEPPTVHRLPFDCGVSAARNHLVESTPSEYKFVVDDDGVFTAETDVDAMVKLLDAYPEAGAVAGTVFRKGKVVSAGSHLQIEGTILRQFAADGPFKEHEGTRFARVDCLPMGVLMRREVFDHVRFDPALKTAAEHFDFFLRMKATPYRALYAPDLTGEHPPHESEGAPYRNLRLRAEFVRLMMVKHGLSRIEMPNGAALELDENGGVTRHSPGNAPQILLA